MTNDFVPGGFPASSGPSPKRGRPTNAEIAARSVQPSRVETEKANRRRRSDTGEMRGLKLAVPKDLKDPNFSYRWFNDKASGRIHDKTVGDDWEVVRTDPHKEETAVVRNVGTGENGQPLKAYLCRKPKEFFEEDKAKALSRIAAQEEAMRQGETGAGGLTGSAKYVPGGSNTIERGR